MPEMTRLKSIRIQGFRSLANVEMSDFGNANVLIGANGSGKSNFMRFFEMLSWMLRSHRLGEFVERHGGANDQLYGGSRTTPAMQAEIGLETRQGRNDYRFTLAHAHPDRLMFTDEAFRCQGRGMSEAPWKNVGSSGHREAQLVEFASSPPPDVEPATVRAIVQLLRNCAVYRFHDTSDSSSFKTRRDLGDNDTLRSDGGNLAAVLYRLEHEDHRRFELICRHITRILPAFDRFEIEDSYGRVQLSIHV